ncbi:MAG: hypothetical protein BGP04_25155 [Rhizobiales bacterium 62-17]|nr:MAG: hypothetical protein BGP04_25155 [Rhizobiales bacterium 62-17]
MSAETVEVFQDRFRIACRIPSCGRLSTFPETRLFLCTALCAFRAQGHDFAFGEWQDFVRDRIEVISEWFGDFFALNPDEMDKTACPIAGLRVPASG